MPQADRAIGLSGSKRQVVLSKVKKLVELYRAGKLGGATHEAHPGLHRGSVGNYIYFTLVPALNFQRNSETLWRAALRTFMDIDTSFVFIPSTVASTNETEVRRALTKWGLAVQANKHTRIWSTLCETLNKYYDGSPRELLRSGNFDVVSILAILAQRKALFPYLSGPKLSNYWLYILSHFTDVELRNKEEISVIPDVHVVRATSYLGLVPQDATPGQVASAWKELLRGTETAPAAVHGPLWRWSRSGFVPDL
jgi:hypothetical protein